MAVDTPSGKHMPIRRRANRISSQVRKISWPYWPTAPVEQWGVKEYEDSPAEVLNRPDIEDENDITWGVAQSEAPVAREPRARVHVLHGEGTNLRKTSSL
jgi:hypothetical protein